MKPESSNEKNMPPFGVVILAAGASARMGEPKLLLPWQGTSVIGSIIRQWQELGASQVAVVHRPNDAPLAAELERLNFPAQNRIENPLPDRGMFSSIVCAANWNGWNEKIESYVLALGDQPHLRSDTLRALLEFHFRHANTICQPFFGDHERHPAILPGWAFKDLKTCQGETLKDFLKLNSGSAVQYPMDDAGLALDMDTPGDYKLLEKLTSAR